MEGWRAGEVKGWMGRGGHSGNSESNSDSDVEDVREPTAQEAFVGYLTELFLDNELKSIHLCSIMWHALQCGIKEAAPYALRPTAQSGKFQPRVKRAMPFLVDDGVLYKFETPFYPKSPLIGKPIP